MFDTPPSRLILEEQLKKYDDFIFEALNKLSKLGRLGVIYEKLCQEILAEMKARRLNIRAVLQRIHAEWDYPSSDALVRLLTNALNNKQAKPEKQAKIQEETIHPLLAGLRGLSTTLSDKFDFTNFRECLKRAANDPTLYSILKKALRDPQVPRVIKSIIQNVLKNS